MAVAGLCDTALIPPHGEAGWASPLIQCHRAGRGFAGARTAQTLATAVPGVAPGKLLSCPERKVRAWPWL